MNFWRIWSTSFIYQHFKIFAIIVWYSETEFVKAFKKRLWNFLMSTRKSGFNTSKTSFASAYMEPILLDLERYRYRFCGCFRPLLIETFPVIPSSVSVDANDYLLWIFYHYTCFMNITTHLTTRDDHCCEGFIFYLPSETNICIVHLITVICTFVSTYKLPSPAATLPYFFCIIWLNLNC